MKRLYFVYILPFIFIACTNSQASKEPKGDSTAITSTEEKIQGPKEVVQSFIEALGNRDFRAAYDKTDGKIWGNYSLFSSEKAFGGITRTYINEIYQMQDENGLKAVYADATYLAMAGNNNYQEIFYLNNNQGTWKIVKLKVLEVNGKTNSSSSDFRLLNTDNSLSDYDLKEMLSYHWKSFPEAFTDQSGNGKQPEIRLIGRQMYVNQGNTYMLVMYGISNPNTFHVSSGRCDAALLMRQNGRWLEKDFAANIGGNNSYGEAGSFDKFIRFGNNNLCASIVSGNVGMGVESSYTEFVGVVNERIYNLGGFESSYSNIESNMNHKESFEVLDKFIPGKTNFYDLELTKKDQLSGTVISRRVIEFVNNKYKVE